MNVESNYQAPGEQVSVLLADDHSLVRRGFQKMLDDDPHIRVVGEAEDGLEAVRLARALSPRVVVMDQSMPRLNGIQATKEILDCLPRTGVLLLTIHSQELSVQAALLAGARGYVLKSSRDVDLADAVKRVAAGERVIPAGVLRNASETEDGVARLSARERQILQLISEGRSSKNIAELLSISACTVSAHRANLMGILNIHRLADLVAFAHRQGLAKARV